MFDGSDFPRQGRKSAGVARQYCVGLGKVANCQARMFLAYVSPLGWALVDKRLYLPQVWTSDDARCQATGMPEDTRGYRPKAALVLELLARALELGLLKAGGLPETTPSGCRRPSVREWGPGDVVCAGSSGRHYGLASEACLDLSGIPGVRAPPQNPSCEMFSAGPWSSGAVNCRRMPGGR